MLRAIFNETRCKSCELCVIACPKHIISISKDKLNEKGYYPAFLVEPDKCNGCTMCAISCPDLVIEIKEVK